MDHEPKSSTAGSWLALAGLAIGAATLITQFFLTLSLSMAAGRGFWASVNAAALGYAAALRNTSFIFLLFIFLGVAFVKIDQRLGRRLR